jgi:hypothetical protein
MQSENRHTYLNFATFILHILSKTHICNFNVGKAINETHIYFRNNHLDERFRDLICNLLNEWDNTEDQICRLIDYIYQAKDFRDLEELIIQDSELKDTFLGQ